MLVGKQKLGSLVILYRKKFRVLGWDKRVDGDPNNRCALCQIPEQIRPVICYVSCGYLKKERKHTFFMEHKKGDREV